MNDNTPTPSKRPEPQLDPAAESATESDEAAFDWMKPTRAGRKGAPEDGHATSRPEEAVAGGAPSQVPGSRRPVSQSPAPQSESARQPETVRQPEKVRQSGSRADRKAAEAAVEPSTVPNESLFSEPLPTSALQIRPPQEDVERRNAERESAANAKPAGPRVMQVLLALFYPVILLVLAVRAITSPLFMWVEYNRPGFPGDGYGFSTDDRMTYGSYAVDYLSNWSGPRYLAELVNHSGEKLFKDGEVSHMADVKLVILSSFAAGALMILLSIVAIIYLRRRSNGGVRRGLFAGSIVTLVIILGLGALAVLGWEQFFTEFHRIFFANGTWTFTLEDTLIRLFPGQFWIDAGIGIGALVIVAALLTLILTWPTRRRRGRVKAATDTGAESSSSEGSDSDAAAP
ncbi:TIGR01906 family membrane protein [Pseudarthrobacter sp. N5]|uniref:TIGR01906 family membrane protein n=1 Tax=Pseudarthrobacter sp. N5 TaxID=3418416 RepID=UPI003CE83484